VNVPELPPAVESVRAANQAFYRAFESLALARMDEVWSHEGQVTCVHPGWEVADGWPAVRRSFETIFRNTTQISLSVDEERIDVRGERAWVVCIERVRSDDSTGAIVATNVFRRDGGRWRMVHHHGSPVLVSPRPSSPGRSTVVN
jgi:ketosteroid isomerase-like protein